MSSEKPSRTLKVTATSTPAPPGDHRKRRRNRTTQSCLNCHASKRMCDRKRPACQRCTTLGLTGLCVYEVDDPNQTNMHGDERALLRNRIAELEGVIREMKNKPHPRWAQKPSDGQSTSPRPSDDDLTIPLITADPRSNEQCGDISISDNINSMPVGTPHLSAPSIHLTPISTSPGTSPACEGPLTPQDPHFLSTFNLPSPPSSSSAPSPTHSHRSLPRIIINEPRPVIGSEFNVDGLLASASLESTGFADGVYGHMLDHIMQVDQARAAEACHCDPSTGQDRSNCGCIGNTMVYNNLLELSVRLRKAVESLGRVANHQSRANDSVCQLFTKICELDKLTSSTLGNATSPADRHPAADAYFPALPAEFIPSTISPNCLNNIHQWESNVIRPSLSTGSDDDAFMSWDGVSRESWAHAPRP
ncbi:uncharacterized protein FOMMEDRAFT_28410 [Fomitiporia mediterranea MF3/22]|uniref:uncharacterized protein n=1 Tax=Fomitiporia mediterranea (strain MF3/22) TaxID=694068 RepID=UPI0004408D07|nr:uncharacterized protein FOMMEDRAFT_28410 [Fomitiporia mediterranea MF3/22]EJD02709.1 hypothetical protein FOMMEDRAFT_28410 [Fomitiporia mediterranea MF3/22]